MSKSDYSFKHYIKHELEPAIAWSSTPAAQKFAADNPYLAPYVTCDPHEDSDCCYLISRFTANVKELIYVGESHRLGRLVTHCFHAATAPTTFLGIDSSEVSQILIEKDEMILPNPTDRKAREMELRKMLKPVLNPPELGDRCIPRADRFDAVHNYYNNPVLLAERIKFVTGKGSCLYNFHTFLRDKTPCCNYNELPLPYGLEERIHQYIASLSKADRADLMRSICENIGEGFFITETTAVKLLARLLSEDPFEQKELLIHALQMQMKQRQELLNELVS